MATVAVNEQVFSRAHSSAESRPFFGEAEFTRFAHVASGLIAATAAVALWLGSRERIAGVLPAFFGDFAVLLTVALLMAYARWRRFARIAHLVCIVLTTALTLRVYTLLILVSARSGAPFIDEQLKLFDRWLGLSTAALASWFRLHPMWNSCSFWAYTSLVALLPIALVLPVFNRTPVHAYRLLLASMLGLTVTSLLLAQWPALGPWSGHIESANIQQQHYTRVLLSLRSAAPVSLAEQTEPLVTFPSFHVFWAITSAMALWPFRRIRWGVAVWAVLICVTTVTTGWHYGVDAIAGAVLAYASYAAASRILPSPALPSRDREEAVTCSPLSTESTLAVNTRSQPVTARSAKPMNSQP